LTPLRHWRRKAKQAKERGRKVMSKNIREEDESDEAGFDEEEE